MIDKKMYNHLRTAVIGVGVMGKHHVRILSEISNLVGIYDLNESHSREVSKKFGTKSYDDLDSLLSEVDAAIIAVPTIYHKDTAEKALHSGVHILIEKPLAQNKEVAKEILDLANDAGLVLAVGHVERHNPAIAYVKEKIGSGEWGSIISISSKRMSSDPKRIIDVGVMFDLGVHDIDIIQYLVDSDVQRIFSAGHIRSQGDVEDHVLVVMEFVNDTIANCEFSWRSPEKIRELTIICEFSYVSVNYMNQTVSIRNSELTDSSEKIIQIKKEEPLKLELLDFLSSIEQKRKPLVTGVEAVKVIDIAESARNLL